MVVIAHQAIRMHPPVEASHNVCQNAQEAGPVLVIVVDRLAPVAARGDVVQRAGEFES